MAPYTTYIMLCTIKCIFNMYQTMKVENRLSGNVCQTSISITKLECFLFLSWSSKLAFLVCYCCVKQTEAGCKHVCVLKRDRNYVIVKVFLAKLLSANRSTVEQSQTESNKTLSSNLSIRLHTNKRCEECLEGILFYKMKSFIQ